MTKISIWVHGSEFGSSMIQVPIMQELWKSSPETCIDLNVVSKNKPIFEYYFSNEIDNGVCSIEKIKLVHELKYNESMNLSVVGTVIAVGRNFMTNSIGLYSQFKRRVYDNDVDLVVSAGLGEVGIMPKLIRRPKRNSLHIFNYLLEYVNFFNSKKMNDIAKNNFIKHYGNFDKTLIQTFFPERDYWIKSLKNVELINAIVRKPTKTKEEIRKELGIEKDEKLVFLALGGAKFFEKLIAIAGEISKMDSSIKFLILPRNSYEAYSFKSMKGFAVPKYLSFDTQNYVGASDAVITKCGFGTITEAIDNKTNIISLHLPNHAEVTETEIILQKEGIIKSSIDLAKDDDIYRRIIFELDNKESRRLMGKIRMDGAKQASKKYLEMLR